MEMNVFIEKLLRVKGASQSKSYLIGLERGMLWAEDVADYFDLKDWSQYREDDALSVVLPEDEETAYKILKAETPIEWENYVRGWLNGVKTVARKQL